MYADLALFAVGLVLLTLGADWVVRGASGLAKRIGINPLVVGLTVVAFGTSAPELVVSGAAALRQQPGLAVGNVMGSTVANVGLIVGLGAVLHPFAVHRRLLVRESPLLIFMLIIVMLLSLNHVVGRLDGLALVGAFLVYLGFLFRWARDERNEDDSSQAARAFSWRRSKLGFDILKLLFGLAALLLGAEWLVASAVVIARAFDVPEAVIGATLVAVGTSVPELASTIAAALRRLGDIALGNIIGSNVFNLGLVLGTAALLRPLELPPEAVIRLVLPALLFCLLLIPLAFTRWHVDRWEGVLLLLLYGGFIYWML